MWGAGTRFLDTWQCGEMWGSGVGWASHQEQSLGFFMQVPQEDSRGFVPLTSMVAVL